MRVYESKKERSTRGVRSFLGFKRYEFKTLLIIDLHVSNLLASIGVFVANDANIVIPT